jgi:sulfate transport system ATP-binding protein
LRRLHDEVHVTTLFVTHDQEEALEVSDQIVVINDGRIEQVGSPEQLYDEPANEFVMGFLGPVTTLGERLVRPHDIEVFGTATSGALAGEVTRLQRIGFEVRAEVRAEGAESWVQLTRGQAEALELAVGSPVWLRAAPHATTLALRQSPRADLGEDGLRGAGAVEPGGAGAAADQGGLGRVGAGSAPEVRGGDPR